MQRCGPDENRASWIIARRSSHAKREGAIEQIPQEIRVHNVSEKIDCYGEENEGLAQGQGHYRAQLLEVDTFLTASSVGSLPVDFSLKCASYSALHFTSRLV